MTLEPLMYTSLTHSTSIRILRLKQGSLGSALECSLHIVDLEDKPSYDALSYIWQLEKDEWRRHPRQKHGRSRTIICNGKELLVLANLFNALLNLRKHGDDLALWIDALCINQGDIVERNNQVGMMNTVFAGALRVIFWLAKASKRTSRAVKAMTELPNNRLHSEPASINASFRSQLSPVFDNNALLLLFRRRWFTVHGSREPGSCKRSSWHKARRFCLVNTK
jgi:Heterokaryon incompatibility protein (HET)